MKKTIFSILILFTKISFGQSDVDVYKYFGGYFEYTFIVNWVDNTFSYSKVGDMIYERSFGKLIKNNDTLILNSSDTAFYSYELKYDPKIADSIKLISSSSESMAPFFCRINDSLVYMNILKIENDSVLSFGITKRSKYSKPITLKIDPNQRRPILIPNNKNVILFNSWIGSWRFYEFNNDKWIMIEDNKITNSITDYWNSIFKNDPKRQNSFKKIKN